MAEMTEIPVIDDGAQQPEIEVKALLDLSNISFVTQIRDWGGGFVPDRCRAQFKGTNSFVLVALSYDSLKALMIQKRVNDLMMS